MGFGSNKGAQSQQQASILCPLYRSISFYSIFQLPASCSGALHNLPAPRLKRLQRVATEAENLLGAMVHNRTETLDLAAEGVSAEFEDDQIPRAILHDRDSHDLKVEVEIGSRAQALAADRDAQAAAQAQAATQAKASGAATAQMMEVHA